MCVRVCACVCVCTYDDTIQIQFLKLCLCLFPGSFVFTFYYLHFGDRAEERFVVYWKGSCNLCKSFKRE